MIIYFLNHIKNGDKNTAHSNVPHTYVICRADRPGEKTNKYVPTIYIINSSLTQILRYNTGHCREI